MNQRDPATTRARERSRLGLAREQNILRTRHIPKQVAGSRGVSVETRVEVLQYANQFSVAAAARKFNVSQSSVYRWTRRVDPLQMTGNHSRVVLTGLDQFLLTICIFLHPRSKADEQATFILANGGARAYSRQEISKRLKELGVTRKICTLEAYQAFTPRNLLRAHLFWTNGPRLGVLGVPRYRLTDTDEAKFTLSKCETKRGVSYTTNWCRDAGHYKKRVASVNLIMTVEPGNPHIPMGERGSITNPRKWWKISLENTNQFVFAEYIDEVLSDIEQNPVPGGYDRQRILMWDNLSAHLTPLVTATVELRQRADEYSFIPLRRPPYQPKYAPIEYMFGEIAGILEDKCARDWDAACLVQEVHNACAMVGLHGSLNRTFCHCGYAI